MTATKKKRCCPSEAQIKELEQTARIFSSDLSNWSFTIRFISAIHCTPNIFLNTANLALVLGDVTNELKKLRIL
jgi:hypothetical protein